MSRRTALVVLLVVVVGAFFVVARSRDGDSPTTSAGVPSGAIEVEILRHVDGDTLHVSPLSNGNGLRAGRDTTVRLLGIDTPESVKPGTPVECFSQDASRRLAELLPVGSRGWAVRDTDLLDQYDRTLLYLWNQDGTFVNLALVRGGYGTAVLYEPNDLYIDDLRAAQARAERKNLGQWDACPA